MTPLMLDKSPWIVSDIDGTLADIRHRVHLMPKDKNGDYTAFNAAGIHDTTFHAQVSLLRLAYEAGWKIALSTGRNKRIEDMTEDFLRLNQIPYHMLLMREEHDRRSDWMVKKDHYESVLRFKNVVLVLEDRERCVDMWRGVGLACLQVRKGDY